MAGKRSHTFFSDEEREAIRRAVEAAEAATSGEIATMVVEESDRYREAEILGGVLVAALAAVIVAVLTQHTAIGSYLPLALILTFPARFLFYRFPMLKFPFVNKRRMMHAVRERAIRAFFEKKLYKTRDENGILIFISFLERKVWILGDRNIDKKVPHETWQALAREISAGLRERRACEALCETVEKCGRILAEHFPKLPDDVNELPDDLIM